MQTTVLVILAIALALAAAVVVMALWRHKQASAGEIKLLGEIATVQTPLAPEGTVIVGGELWPAKSRDGGVISSRARVCVVGFEDFLVLVEVCE